jgi:hypothetical protein
MVGTASFFSPLQDSPARGRFLLALAASACLHVSVAGRLLTERLPTFAPPKAPTVIAARLIPLADVTSDESSVPEQKVRGAQEQWDGAAAVSLEGGGKNAPQALPPPEKAYYPATELDVFPRPLAALELRRLESVAGGAAGIRAIVKIDERGIVQDIELLQGGPPGRVQEELRTMLTAAGFAPARKDGQAVRSRIVLDIRFPAAGDDY